MEFEYKLDINGTYSKIDNCGDMSILPVELSLNTLEERNPLLIIKIPEPVTSFSSNTSWLDCNIYTNYEGIELYLNFKKGHNKFLKSSKKYLITLEINNEKLFLYFIIVEFQKSPDGVLSYGWNSFNSRSSGDIEVPLKGAFIPRLPVVQLAGELTSCIGKDDCLYVTSNCSISCFKVPEELEPAGITPLWSHTISEKINFFPVLMGDFICFSSNSGNLICYSLYEKRQLWTCSIPGGGLRSLFCAEENLVFSSSKDFNIYATDAEDGKIKWKYPLKGQRVNPLNTKRGKLFVSFDSIIQCLDIRNGSLLWHKDFDGHILKFSPAVTDNLLFTFAQAGIKEFVVAMDPFNGNIIWKKEMHKKAGYHIISSGDSIFVILTDEINCYDFQGRLKWNHKIGNMRTSVCYHMGYLYYLSDAGGFNILEGKTGEVKLSLSKPMKIKSPVFTTGGRVFFPCENGMIYGYGAFRLGRYMTRKICPCCGKAISFDKNICDKCASLPGCRNPRGCNYRGALSNFKKESFFAALARGSSTPGYICPACQFVNNF